MNVTFKLEDTDRIMATLSVTMPLGSWKRLRDSIKLDTVIGSEFSAQIRDMVDAAEKHLTQLDKKP